MNVLITGNNGFINKNLKMARKLKDLILLSLKASERSINCGKKAKIVHLAGENRQNKTKANAAYKKICKFCSEKMSLIIFSSSPFKNRQSIQ